MRAKQIVKEFLTYLIESDEINVNKLQELLHADYLQYVDGKILNREQCIEHAVSVKNTVKNGKISFEQLFEEGEHVCSVHIAEGEKFSGAKVKFKVIAYFEIRESKIFLFDELTRMLEGKTEDADLTSRN